MKTVAAAIEFGTSKIITLLAESGGFTRCEIIGSGTFFGISLFGAAFEPALLFVMAPGGFITLGVMMILVNQLTKKLAAKGV